jgi:hypothetical protein
MKAKYNEMWSISLLYYIPTSHPFLTAKVSAYNSLHFVLFAVWLLTRHNGMDQIDLKIKIKDSSNYVLEVVMIFP